MRKSRKAVVTAISIAVLTVSLAVLLASCGGTTTTSAGVSTSGTGQGGEPTGDPIVIGAVVSTTGPNAPRSNSWRPRSTPPVAYSAVR